MRKLILSIGILLCFMNLSGAQHPYNIPPRKNIDGIPEATKEECDEMDAEMVRHLKREVGDFGKTLEVTHGKKFKITIVIEEIN